MSVQETDLIAVSRNGVDYKTTVSNVENLLDTDLIAVNRNGVDYSCAASELIQDQGPSIKPFPPGVDCIPGTKHLKVTKHRDNTGYDHKDHYFRIVIHQDINKDDYYFALAESRPTGTGGSVTPGGGERFDEDSWIGPYIDGHNDGRNYGFSWATYNMVYPGLWEEAMLVDYPSHKCFNFCEYEPFTAPTVWEWAVGGRAPDATKDFKQCDLVPYIIAIPKTLFAQCIYSKRPEIPSEGASSSMAEGFIMQFGKTGSIADGGGEQNWVVRNGKWHLISGDEAWFSTDKVWNQSLHDNMLSAFPQFIDIQDWTVEGIPVANTFADDSLLEDTDLVKVSRNKINYKATVAQLREAI